MDRPRLMTEGSTQRLAPVVLDGKFFQAGHERFILRGVSYGPLAPPHGSADLYASPERTANDFELLRRLGANLLRVYSLPPLWFLDLAAAHGLRLLIDANWSKEVCFLDSAAGRQAAVDAVRSAADRCAPHLATFALSVVNEIPADLVRWMGPRRVEDFIDQLIAAVKRSHPRSLCTFGNFPTTEFLRPQGVDFHCFNVYLHQPRSFDNYLARLQMLSDGKPLILGETGIDSLREGESNQASILGWQIETAFRNGLAGAIVYGFTDEWFKDGRLIGDWAFGLTRADRSPKPAFESVRRQFQIAPRFPLGFYPRVSIVVAAYNAERLLPACLESLRHLHYPNYEVLLVDDGSTDGTPEIASRFPEVRWIRHAENLGLSVARNTGMAASQGEIVAFTDADCRVDEDWLHYLVNDLQRGDYAAVGGPNLLPPDDSCLAAAVMVSPGGPTHVMLNERLAEHIPGCNMAFYRWALEEVGGFDPVFRQAGDDVDICWRLQQRGCRIGFSPSAFVWHYRRSTVGAYLRQQYGYGKAEALLIRKHPEYFNRLGSSIWQGRIYSPVRFPMLLRRSMIYHGSFASGLFQTLYTSAESHALAFFTSIEYYVFGLLPLLVLATAFGLFHTLLTLGILLPALVCTVAAGQAILPIRKSRAWSRPLVALLFWLQPIVRGYARYHGRFRLHRTRLENLESLDSVSLARSHQALNQVDYWSENGVQRMAFLKAAVDRLEADRWEYRTDSGWNPIDLEVFGSRWTQLQLVTAAESHSEGRTLIRCRIGVSSTLLAKTILGVLLAGSLLVAGTIGPTQWYAWLPLLSLPLWIVWLVLDGRRFQRVLIVFLNRVANQLRLLPVLPPDRTSPT